VLYALAAVARPADRKFAGISLGGLLVIAGLIVAFAWSFILGIIIAVIGLAAFGGFVRASGTSGRPITGAAAQRSEASCKPCTGLS
jgi:hypothetical protein